MVLPFAPDWSQQGRIGETVIRTTPIDSRSVFLGESVGSIVGSRCEYCSRDSGVDLSAVQPNVEEHAVIVLANVANPNAEIGDLVEYVRSGGGLLVSLGSNTNIATSNQVWAPLFPTSFKDRHSLASDYGLGFLQGYPVSTSSVFSISTLWFGSFQRRNG